MHFKKELDTTGLENSLPIGLPASGRDLPALTDRRTGRRSAVSVFAVMAHPCPVPVLVHARQSFLLLSLPAQWQNLPN